MSVFFESGSMRVVGKECLQATEPLVCSMSYSIDRRNGFTATVACREWPWELSVRRELIGREARDSDHEDVDGTFEARRGGRQGEDVEMERW